MQVEYESSVTAQRTGVVPVPLMTYGPPPRSTIRPSVTRQYVADDEFSYDECSLVLMPFT